MNIHRHQEPQPGASRTVRFDGHQYGSEVSAFVVDYDPGRGTELHVHPYAETWFIRRGEAEFTLGENKARGTAGDIVVGPANIPHCFKNIGNDRLEVVCIHPRDTIQQTAL